MKLYRFTGVAIVALIACLQVDASYAATRPEMPAAFDAATVQKLIDSIEKPPNAMILRSGYFVGHRNQAFPIGDGFLLLQQAADKEPGDTKRWFVLQYTLAFALFRLPRVSGSADIGFTAYDALFAHADKAGAVDALYTLRQAINDFLFSVQGRLRDLHLRDDERTQKTMLKAWTAYVSVLTQEAKAKPKYVAPEPMWAQALAASGWDDVFVKTMETTLDDPAAPKTFALYKAATSVLEQSKPERTLEILKQARPLLPEKDLNEAAWYFGKLVDINLRRATHDDKGKDKPLDKTILNVAIAAQEEMVKTTGRGRARLAELRTKAGNTNAYADLVTQLSVADALEPEIIAAAEMLAEQQRATDKAAKPGDADKHDEKLSALQVSLLTKYLAASRKRDVALELRARYMLGLIYINRKQPDAARAALQTDGLTVLPRGRAHYELEAVQRLRASLETPKNP